MPNYENATPRPWKISDIDGLTIRSDAFDVCTMMGDHHGCIVADFERGIGGRNHARREANANAALIVTAVNAYDRDQATIAELREALEEIIRDMNVANMYARVNKKVAMETIRIARAALDRTGNMTRGK